MILSYGMKNFASFKDGVNVSFELKTNRSKKASNNNPVTNILCVNGANGSGKTNLLKGLAFLSSFCCNSFVDYKPKETIIFDSFFFKEKPTDFFVEFIAEGIKYRYECSITRNKVVYEKIYRKIKKTSLLIHRVDNGLVSCVNEFKEICEIKKIRSNASIISISNQHEVRSIDPIYNFFDLILPNVTYTGLATHTKNLTEAIVTKFYKNDKKMFKFMEQVICNSDIGISEISIKSVTNEEDKKEYYPVFYHKFGKTKFPLLYSYESSGTKSLYMTLFRYWYTLNSGGLLIMDEFDINLHPHILPNLLEFFSNPKTNKKNAQLLFTTHNINILDDMGKYRTFFVNKEHNESFGYRLDEIPGDIIRNDRNILSLYNSGKIGGVPKI